MDTKSTLTELVSKLTDDEIADARLQCEGKGFDVPAFDAAAAVLSILRDKTAVLTSEMLEHLLPRKISKLLIANLNAIVTHLQGVRDGQDVVAKFASAIEEYELLFWLYNIDGHSREVLEFQTKMKQLQSMENETKKLRRELTSALKVKSSLEKCDESARDLLTDISQRKEESEKILAGLENESSKVKVAANHLLERNSADLNAAVESSKSLVQQVEDSIRAVNAHEKEASTMVKGVKDNDATVTALKGRISAFVEQIDANTIAMKKLTTDAEKAVVENASAYIELSAKVNSTFAEMTKHLAEEEAEIVRLTQLATGVGRFREFSQRQKKVSDNAERWKWYAISSFAIPVVGVILLTIFTQSVTELFWVRLALVIPFVFLFEFCQKQYNRERRLEEEYAFKANISVSLKPYQELVEEILEKNEVPDGQEPPSNRDEYTKFVIASVKEVFDNPNTKIFADGKKGTLEKEADAETVEQFSKNANFIFEIIKKFKTLGSS